MSEVSAVLFAKDHRTIARFYQEALGWVRISAGDDHSVLNCCGFELIVHPIPQQLLAASGTGVADGRRGNSPFRLDFPVESLENARAAAARLGGQIDEKAPVWAPDEANFRLGHDPEGNVFRVIEQSGSTHRANEGLR